MDINAKLGETDVTIAEVADQLIQLRAVAGGLRIDDSILTGAKRQAGIALLTSTLDLGAAIAKLNKCDPRHSWVAAHALQRPQFEQLMRGAFFAGPASVEEAKAFVGEDLMPKRRAAGRKLVPISLAQLTGEASAHWGGGDIPSEVLKGTKSDLNGLVHGGKAIVDVYTHGESVGANKASPYEICASMNNPLAVSAIALQTLIALSEPGEARDAALLELERTQHLLDRMRPVTDAVLGPETGE